MKFIKTLKDVPAALKDELNREQNRYNGKLLNIVSIVASVAFTILLLWSILVQGDQEPIIKPAYYIVAYAFIIIISLSYIVVSRFQWADMAMQDKIVHLKNYIYLLVLAVSMSFITWMDLHYQWDLTAFLVTLFIISTSIWLSSIQYAVLSNSMMLVVILGMFAVNAEVHATPYNVLKLLILLMVGWFLMLTANSIKITNFLAKEDLEAKNKEIEYLSYNDPLTGLKNRRYLEISFETIQSISERQKNPYSLILLDIDHFKQINEQFGRQMGDKVLVGAASEMISLARKSDEIFRFGGKQFLILLMDTDKEGSLILANRLRQSVEENLSTGLNQPVTVSMGIADSYEGKDLEKLISLTDERLTKAIKAGRNSVKVS